MPRRNVRLFQLPMLAFLALVVSVDITPEAVERLKRSSDEVWISDVFYT